MLDYVFWLTDSSDRAALHYAERVNKKFRSRGFSSTGIRIKEDFTLIDYNPEEYEAYLAFRNEVMIAHLVNQDNDGEFKHIKVNVGTASTGNEDDTAINQQIEQYKAEHENLVEEVPVAQGTIGLLIRCNMGSLNEVKKYLKNERISYHRITEWTDDNNFPPKYVEFLRF